MGNTLLFEVPRSHTTRCKRAFTSATEEVWNVFTAKVDVRDLNTPQVKAAIHEPAVATHHRLIIVTWKCCVCPYIL